MLSKNVQIMTKMYSLKYHPKGQRGYRRVAGGPSRMSAAMPRYVAEFRLSA